MRWRFIFLLMLFPLLVACKILPDGSGSVSTAEPSGAASQPLPSDTIRPKPRPAAVQAASAVPVKQPVAEPPPPVVTEPEQTRSQAQILCEKRGNTWGNAGKSFGQTCIKRTRDAGKQCKKQSSCEGLCLARSGTCAPVTPLFGCNEIFQNDGSRVTLCID